MQFEVLGEKWADLSFRDFSLNAQLLGGVSSEKVNALVSTLSEEKVADHWLRFLLALHFQLGRRAEFVLNDVAISRLLQFIELSKKHAQMGVVAELCVLLLALNTAASTIGVESQLCAEFLRATPELQRMLMPVVHRAFYHRGSSLSGDQFTQLIVKQALELSFHEHLRVFALTNSSTATVAVWIESQLLHADILGPKPLFGSAPAAVSIDNERCARVFTLLHYMDTPLPSQVQHQYLVSAVGAFLRTIDRRKLPPLPLSAAGILADYLLELFAQLSLCVSSKKFLAFSHKRFYGLRYVEAVASDALYISARLASWYREELGDALNGEVTGFMYAMLQAGKAASFRLPLDEAPELQETDIQIPLMSGEDPGSVPLFGPEVLLRCIEFQIEVSSGEEVLKFFDDIFREKMWNFFIEDSSFALQLCMLLLRNTAKLSLVLPSLAPRVLWLLSRQPHTLLPLVKRLIPFLFDESTALDIFFRIVFLPLITFADDFTPPKSENAPDEVMVHYVFFVELWSAMTDWSVSKKEATRLAMFCMRHARSFEAWDSLHGNIGSFSPKMVCAFRVIRPLLQEYFQCPNLPNDIFEAMSVAYFFLVSPRYQRSVVTEYIQEMGRWVAEQRPLLVLHSTASFHTMLAQDFIPEGLRCWRMQRWAAIVLSTALSAVVDHEATIKEAARFFDVIHEQIWELLATASSEAVIGMKGTAESGDAGGKGDDSLVFAHSLPFSNPNSSFLDCSPFMGEASDSAGASEIREPNWQLDQTVWTAGEEPLRLNGSNLSEHLHALFLALAGLSRICPNVKERGIICLANAVRTLSKATTGPSRDNGGLIATATLCMKLLRYPPISGLTTMPLHALLGIHVLGVPASLTRHKIDAAAASS